MSLQITGVVHDNGPACNHLTVTVNHEGTIRTFKTSFGEIDTLYDYLSVAEQGRLLILLWAKYRRALARVVIGVDIA